MTAGADGTAQVWRLGRNDWPAEDLERLAELLGGSRIGADAGSLVPLDAGALRPALGRAARPAPRSRSGRVREGRLLHWLAEVELVHRHYGYRDPHVQRYEQITDYRAQSWPQPRRVVVKVEVTPEGSQRRFVVTNLREPERQLYRDFYVQRGAVPEQPIGELKNALRADRLSSSGFCANALKLLVAVAAYALAVLYKEACAAVAGVANADIQTLRSRLWKVPAEVRQEARRVRVSLPEGWPGRSLWERTLQAVGHYAGAAAAGRRAARAAAAGLLSAVAADSTTSAGRARPPCAAGLCWPGRDDRPVIPGR